MSATTSLDRAAEQEGRDRTVMRALTEIARRLRDGRLTSNVGALRPLADAPAAFGPDAPHASGKTIIQLIEGW